MKQDSPWKLIVPGIIFVSVFSTGFSLWVITLLKGEPYELSLQYIKENTQVAEMIGQSIEPGWPVLGSITNSGTASYSDIYYAIRGDVSKATVHIKASKYLNEWQLDEVIVTPTDGQAMIQTFH